MSDHFEPRCEVCGLVVDLTNRDYETRQERRPIYGRIGAPSSQVTGYTRPVTFWTCGPCVTGIDPHRGIK